MNYYQNIGKTKLQKKMVYDNIIILKSFVERFIG